MTDAQEGALRGWRRLMYRFHLRICPYCVAHRRQLESIVDVVKALPPEEHAADARARALAAFRNKKVQL